MRDPIGSFRLDEYSHILFQEYTNNVRYFTLISSYHAPSTKPLWEKCLNANEPTQMRLQMWFSDRTDEPQTLEDVLTGVNVVEHFLEERSRSSNVAAPGIDDTHWK